MSTRKIVRPADVTREAAAEQIKEAGMELVSLRLVDESGRKIASADAIGRTDLQWEATIKVAEFPFEEDSPKGESEPESKGDDPTEGEGGDDPLGLDDADEDSASEDEKADDKILDLVKQIAEHMGIHVDGGEEPPADEAAGLDLPDVGAPEENTPLSPPVEKASVPGAAGGTFSHIVVANAEAMKGRRSFVAIVENSNVLNDGEIVREAQIAFPGYKVAGRIDRVTLAADNEARVPLIAEAKGE